LVTPAAAPNGASGKKVSLQRLRGLASLTGDFCNKIGTEQPSAPAWLAAIGGIADPN